MAYAAVQTLMHLLEGITDADPNWVLHNKQQIEFLKEKVSFLRKFLKKFSIPTNEAVRDLELRIRDTAYNTEYMIESYLCDQILKESDGKNEEMRYQTFYKDLEKAIEETLCMQEEAMVLELTCVQQRNSLPVDRLKLLRGKNTAMVGLDDELNKIKDWLINSSFKREVISIVGMGGIGKTTLARNVFDDQLTVCHFDIRSWVTVSQEYQVREILAGLLQLSTSELSPESEENLDVRLHKSLKDRRYLIVMDDIWDPKAWDGVRRLFPDDNNGSRIILTTRLADVGDLGNHVLNSSFLSSSDSWNLLCKKVFEEEACPDYLVGIGQEIARFCQGLPLSLVVVGGLLSMDQTLGYWETVANYINSFLAIDGGQCSKILSLSYNHLPVHLKPCFLYFAVFPEDYDIPRSKLIKLWVAEGFLKPNKSNSLEDIAERYLEDLVNRSLIMVHSLRYDSKVKTYRIHDLLRGFCIREVEKEKFLHVTNSCPNIPSEEYIYNSNGLALLTRSLQCHSYFNLSVTKLLGFRLLKILDIARIRLNEFPLEVIGLVHLRYLSLFSEVENVPGLISTIWNLQTFIITRFNGFPLCLPVAIWNMQHLRHIKVHTCLLPDPSITSFVSLVNLTTLSTIRNLAFTEEIVKRIPKLKKLKVSYVVTFEQWPHYHLSNIVCLNELETLDIVSASKMAFPPNFKFPVALKKLILRGVRLPWKDMTMVGSLPNLEVLMLQKNACRGDVWGVWEPNEGEFCELKFLQLDSLDLVRWRANNSHFPKLKRLDIFYCRHLKEIPFEIGNIATLEMIELYHTSSSVEASANLILEEHQSCFGDDATLQVRIKNVSDFKKS